MPQVHASLIACEHKEAEHLCIGRTAALSGKRQLSARRCFPQARKVETAEALMSARYKIGRTNRLDRASLGIVLASLLSLSAAPGHAATIKVMCDSPVEPALTKVADLFSQETNNQVTFACNAGPAVKKKIED